MPSIYLVDAFCGAPFSGNPAGVCPVERAPSEVWMQNVAMEMNQAETAFFWPEGPGYRLRWFTPGGEVDLCGHATLAAAHTLWAELSCESDEVNFETKSGRLTAKLLGSEIALDFPAEPAVEADIPIDLPGATWTGRNRMDFFAAFNHAEEIRKFVPNHDQIVAAGPRGLIITAPSEGSDADFISRFFAPVLGVPEDPVTGSAHCCLSPFWAERMGRNDLTGYQASRRGGYVRTVLRGDRVELIGRAETTVKGELAAAGLHGFDGS